MKIKKVFVDGVIVPERLRRLNPEKVTALAESMATIGLIQPITIWPVTDDAVELVSGRHRLAAAEALDWDMIPAIFIDADEIDRQLIEIDENLCRAELTELEMADHHVRRKALMELRGKARKAGGDRKSSGQNVHLKSYADETADKLSVDPKTVRRAVKRGRDIPDDIKQAITGTPAADKGVELDALASMKPDDQREAVRMVEAGSATDFRDAKQFIDGVDPEEDRIEKDVTRLY